MSRYIDADKMISDTKAMKQIAEGISIDGIIKYIDKNSLTDVAKVVRCKDCKHLMFSDMYGECSQAHMGIARPDDFCSYGEGR